MCSRILDVCVILTIEYRIIAKRLDIFSLNKTIDIDRI